MAGHTVTITWTASIDMPATIPAGDGYNVYKGAAPGAEGSTPINGSTPIQANQFVDTNVVFGTTYDYYVTAVVGGKESAASQQVSAAVSLPEPPTNVVAMAA